MAKPPNKLTPTGENAEFLRWCNQLLAYVESITPRPTVDTFLTRTPSGFFQRPRVNPKPGEPSEIVQLRVKTQRPRYLVCKELEYSPNSGQFTEGETVYVAKPSLLRNVAGQVIFYNRTLTYTPNATDAGRRSMVKTGEPSKTYSEFTYPPYVVNGTDPTKSSVIYAAKTTQSLGLYADQEGLETAPEIEYVDINTDARRWLKEFETCVDDANSKQLLDISERYT